MNTPFFRPTDFTGRVLTLYIPDRTCGRAQEPFKGCYGEQGSVLCTDHSRIIIRA